MLLLVVTCGCAEKAGGDADAGQASHEYLEVLENVPGRKPDEIWYNVLLNGRKAGRHRLLLWALDGKPDMFLADTRTELVVGSGKEASLSVFERRALVDSNDVLSALRWREKEGDEVMIEGKGVETSAGRWMLVKGGKMAALRTDGPVRLPIRYRWLFDLHGDVPSRVVNYVEIDTENLQLVEKEIHLFPASAGRWNEVSASCRPPGGDSAGWSIAEQRPKGKKEVEQLLVFGKDGIPRCASTSFGMLRLEFLRTESEPELPGKPVDLRPFESVPFEPPWPKSESPEFVVYRMEGLPDGYPVEMLEGPGQDVIAHPGRGIFLVKVTESPVPPVVPYPGHAGMQRFLDSTALLPLDAESIRSVTRRLSAGKRQAFELATEFRRFVSLRVEPNRRFALVPADKVLQSGRGDCAEQATLLVALLRAAGIPARAVMGLFLSGKEFRRHMWVEAW
ncbi:MAG: transglutaminase domain-containing protein, partial [Deltaproteobacteria bacterium]